MTEGERTNMLALRARQTNKPEDIEAVMAAVTRMVIGRAAPYALAWGADDAAAIAWEGAYRALSTWNPDQSMFSTWCYGSIGRALHDNLKYTRRKGRTGETVSLEQRHEFIADAEDTSVETTILAQACFEAMQPREQEVVRLYYWEDLALKEISVLLGISETRAWQLIRQGVERARKAVA